MVPLVPGTWCPGGAREMGVSWRRGGALRGRDRFPSPPAGESRDSRDDDLAPLILALTLTSIVRDGGAAAAPLEATSQDKHLPVSAAVRCFRLVVLEAAARTVSSQRFISLRSGLRLINWWREAKVSSPGRSTSNCSSCVWSCVTTSITSDCSTLKTGLFVSSTTEKMGKDGKDGRETVWVRFKKKSAVS